jgi:thioredoxin reductase
METEVLIVGAGPAGLACLQGLAGSRITAIAFDPAPGGWPLRMEFFCHEIGDIARDYVRRRFARELAAVVSQRIDRLRWDGSQWQAESGNHVVAARHVVVATGLQIRTAGLVAGERLFVGPSYRLYHHCDVSGKKVAVVGGGDNAFEYACMAAETGANVTLYHRSIRATDGFVRRAATLANVTLRRIEALPLITETPDAVWVDGDPYDLCAAMLGFEPVKPPIEVQPGTPEPVRIGDLDTLRPPRLLHAIESGQQCANRIRLLARRS